MTRDPEAWNPRDRHYRRGYRAGRAQAGLPRGCRLLALLPICVGLAWAAGWLYGAVT